MSSIEVVIYIMCSMCAGVIFVAFGTFRMARKEYNRAVGIMKEASAEYDRSILINKRTLEVVNKGHLLKVIQDEADTTIRSKIAE